MDTHNELFAMFPNVWFDPEKSPLKLSKHEFTERSLVRPSSNELHTGTQTPRKGPNLLSKEQPVFIISPAKRQMLPKFPKQSKILLSETKRSRNFLSPVQSPKLRGAGLKQLSLNSPLPGSPLS